MDLSTELAQRCLQVKRAAAEDFTPEREEFEDLSSRERVSREQAARYQGIARSRAREEAEKTPAETFTGRLYPVPHTLGEAAWRLPAVTAGGVLGYRAVARNEIPDVEHIRRLVQPAGTKETTIGFSQFGKRMYDRLKALNHPDPVGMVHKLESKLLASPDVLPALTAPNVPVPVGAPPGAQAAAQMQAANKMRALRHLLEITKDPKTGARDPETVRRISEEAELALAGRPKGKKGATPLPSEAFFRESLAPDAVKIEGPKKDMFSQFGALVEDQLKAYGRDETAASNAAREVETLFRQKPELARQVLGMRPEAVLGEEALAAKKMIESTVGKLGTRSGTEVVRQALHDAAVAGKAGLGEGLSKWRRYGGAAAGGLAATLLTGIPLGAYALWKRREGGEAAARAKARMQEELDKAEEASRQREAILARMGT